MSKSVNVDFVTRQIEVDTDGKEYYVSAAVAAKDAEQSMLSAQNSAKEVKEIYGDGNFTPLSDLLGGLGTKLKRWGAIFANKVFASNLPIVYNSVAEMKADTMLWEGMNTKTLGYYEPDDGGGGSYLVRAKADADVDDGGTIHELSNGLVAELIVENGTVCPEQFGAKGDGSSDDSISIAKCFQACFKISMGRDKTYRIISSENKSFVTVNNLELYGNESTLLIEGGDNKQRRIIEIPESIVDGYAIIKGLTIKGVGSYVAPDDNEHFMFGDNLRTSNITPICIAGRCKKIILEDLHFDNILYCCRVLENSNTDYETNLFIKRCTSTDNCGMPFLVNNCNNITLKDCSLEYSKDTTHFCHCFYAINTIERFIIDNCYFNSDYLGASGSYAATLSLKSFNDKCITKITNTTIVSTQYVMAVAASQSEPVIDGCHLICATSNNDGCILLDNANVIIQNCEINTNTKIIAAYNSIKSNIKIVGSIIKSSNLFFLNCPCSIKINGCILDIRSAIQNEYIGRVEKDIEIYINISNSTFITEGKEYELVASLPYSYQKLVIDNCSFTAEQQHRFALYSSENNQNVYISCTTFYNCQKVKEEDSMNGFVNNCVAIPCG